MLDEEAIAERLSDPVNALAAGVDWRDTFELFAAIERLHEAMGKAAAEVEVERLGHGVFTGRARTAQMGFG